MPRAGSSVAAQAGHSQRAPPAPHLQPANGQICLASKRLAVLGDSQVGRAWARARCCCCCWVPSLQSRCVRVARQRVRAWSWCRSGDDEGVGSRKCRYCAYHAVEATARAGGCIRQARRPTLHAAHAGPHLRPAPPHPTCHPTPPTRTFTHHNAGAAPVQYARQLPRLHVCGEGRRAVRRGSQLPGHRAAPCRAAGAAQRPRGPHCPRAGAPAAGLPRLQRLRLIAAPVHSGGNTRVHCSGGGWRWEEVERGCCSGGG